MSFETTLQQRVKDKLFAFSDGYQPPSLNGTFRRLMRDSGLLKSPEGQNRTLYSLRHTYATLALLEGMDIHTLARQMGNSAAMIERHYSHLKPLMIAEQLAGAIPDAKTAEAEEIRRYTQISTVREDVMSLVAATTGIHIALKVANPSATQELRDELKKATAKSR